MRDSIQLHTHGHNKAFKGQALECVIISKDCLHTAAWCHPPASMYRKLVTSDLNQVLLELSSHQIGILQGVIVPLAFMFCQ